MYQEQTMAPASAGTCVRRPEEIAAALAPAIAAGAARADEEDRFVAENFALLRDSGLVEAGVPRDLGGGGADVAALAGMLRTIARACGSTALAFAMHTHQVAVPAWRRRVQGVAAVEPLLRRVAADRLILLSSGGSDWIGGSGEARRVDGGYRVNARKVFTSGAPAGDLLMTGAVLDEGGERMALHFAVSMRAEQVRIEETWRALGMRGSGSHDVVIEDLFVPDSGVALARKAGAWHPLFEIIATIAFPLIYAVYLGVAEAARDIALDLAKRRPAGAHQRALAGRMDTALRAAELAHGSMVAAAERDAPSPRTVNDVMIGRALVAEHAVEAVGLAMELAGGAGFYRAAGLERRFREVQAARFHPLQSGPQAQFAGAIALGQPTDTIW